MTIQCKVKSVTTLAAHTHKVVLSPLSTVDYKAGQYLMVVMGEKDKRPFSIASSPDPVNNDIELHIGASQANPYAMEVVEAAMHALHHDGVIEIDAPHGTAWIKEDLHRPILLIAGGTGFSYVNAILDFCIGEQRTQPIYLYWGARQAEQLYAFDELSKRVSELDNVHFVPVVEDATPKWHGKVGNVLQAVAEDFESLSEHEIYIAGRFEMAGAAREMFTSQKDADIHRIHGDAFAFI